MSQSIVITHTAPTGLGRSPSSTERMFLRRVSAIKVEPTEAGEWKVTVYAPKEGFGSGQPPRRRQLVFDGVSTSEARRLTEVYPDLLLEPAL